MGGFKRKTISKIGLNALNYVDAVTGTKRQAPGAEMACMASFV